MVVYNHFKLPIMDQLFLFMKESGSIFKACYIFLKFVDKAFCTCVLKFSQNFFFLTRLLILKHYVEAICETLKITLPTTSPSSICQQGNLTKITLQNELLLLTFLKSKLTTCQSKVGLSKHCVYLHFEDFL